MKRLYDALTWNRIAQFFENGDLVPFAVLISAWHFINALITYGGENIAVAFASGVFVDMLHFRTVRSAVRDRNRAAVIIALVTTAVSYGFHLLFYVNGQAVFRPVYLLLAAPLPLGIPILAWQQERSRSEQQQADTSAMQELAAENRRLQDSNRQLQATIKDQQKIIKDWQALNVEAQTLAQFNAKLISVEEAASKIGVKDVRTVQSRAAKLNGVANGHT
jgi:hypothetical protein